MLFVRVDETHVYAQAVWTRCIGLVTNVKEKLAGVDDCSSAQA